VSPIIYSLHLYDTFCAGLGTEKITNNKKFVAISIRAREIDFVEAATAPSRWDFAHKRGDSAVKNDLNSNEKPDEEVSKKLSEPDGIGVCTAGIFPIKK
jgi:hypothetical protein